MTPTTTTPPDVNPNPACPGCGKPLPARAPEGLCPACLLAGASGTDPGSHAGQRRFEPPPLDRISELFPHLEVQRLLGAGGMGAVYLARQPALDRQVALKILPADSGGSAASFRERFNREARALARLSHPNIVAVHEFGETGGLHYFVMEYVDGANLRQLQAGGRLAPREALQLIPQICDALQYAHDAGVVHRDIKPENVLVDRRGRVKIADFGLAKIVDPAGGSCRLTLEGQVMGTPHYMAPEQVERPLAVDHRADIYALGVVFYELLTGDLPLGKFAPPSRKVEVDVRLDEIVLRALENDPARRYQQAGEVKRRVETVMEEPAPHGTHPSPETPVPSEPKPLHWLGIPVAVQRGDEREVSFQGALTAIFVTMLVTLLAHMATRVITGGEHALGGALHLAGLFVALWGIRRTLNAPVPEPLPRTENGTVVVDPHPKWPYRFDVAMLVGLFLGVIGLHYLGRHVLTPLVRQITHRAEIRQRAERNPVDGTLTATLPNGGVIRLVAVARDTRGVLNQWWRPDGRTTAPEFEVHNAVTAGPESGTPFSLLFEVENLPAGASGPLFEGEPGSWAGSGAAVFSGGRRLDRSHLALFGWADPPRRATVRAGLALEPWRTVATYSPSDRRLQWASPTRPGEPRWEIQIHDVTDATEGAQVTAVLPAENRDWRIDLAAFDRSGKEALMQRASGSGTAGGRVSVWTYLFPGVPVAELAEIRIRTRPVHWVEFAGVELSPATPLPEPHRLRLAPETRLRFDAWADLDTLQTTASPSTGPESNPLAGIPDLLLWAQAAGFDVHAGADGLEVLNATFAQVGDSEWDRLDGQAVIDRVYRGRFAPKVLKPTGPGSAGNTFAYETREGGFGLIRLESVGADAGAGPAVIRLRRVER